MSKEHHFSIQRNVRYYTDGELTVDTKHIWFVLHGYGQLPQYFIRKFQSITSTETLIVAPEGLHRYYLEGSKGRVGASWMTKEDRLTDINDYVQFLDRLYEHVLKGADSGIMIHLLGFSQGAATASRWVVQGKSSIDTLILWSSVFPPDMDLGLSKSALNRSKNFLVYGTEDPLLPKDKLQEIKNRLKGNKIDYELKSFEGGHDIDRETLQKLNRLLSQF